MSKDVEGLQGELERTARDSGIEYFGAADVTSAHDHMARLGGEFLRAFPRAVSLGSRLSDAIVDQIKDQGNERLVRSYQWHIYEITGRFLDSVALQMTKMLQAAGYQAHPIHASQYMDADGLSGMISNKIAAHLSGLGWIGKSVLLVTPEAGPRARWATVLTDAPLEPGKPMERRCGDCTECVEICPVSAFTGVDFDPLEPREKRFDAHVCADYNKHRHSTVMSKLAAGSNCGLCVYICPHGRSEE